MVLICSVCVCSLAGSWVGVVAGGGGCCEWCGFAARFLVVCGVVGWRPAGWDTSFFVAGGRCVTAKTLLKRGVFDRAKKQNRKKKRNEEKSTKHVPEATPSKIWCWRENGRENHAKTRCLEVKKKTPETKTPVDKKRR